MSASISPTTLGHSPAHFRSITEATYSRQSIDWGIPANDDACERILRAAETVPMTSELARYLAGFLGASSRVWTSARRARLRTLIANAGEDGVSAALIAVARTPREEVIDEAASVLVAAAAIDTGVVAFLAEAARADDPRSRAPRNETIPADHPSVRATIARAFGRIRGMQTRERRIIALARALGDPAVEVRDAAIQALAASEDPLARRLLELRRPLEREPFLVDAIVEALTELGAE